MAAAGPLRTLQIALEGMTTAPALSRQLAALQRRWGMALTESPPVRQWADWSELVGR
jgi:hypothetical protein